MCYAVSMLTEFIMKKLKTARYKILDGGVYFGEIPGVQGVWADASTLEACRAELRDVLEEWVLLSVRNKKAVPGLKFKADRRALVR